MSDKKEKRMELIIELLTQQMNHWMLFPLLVTLMGCMYIFVDMEKPDTLMWLICGILPVLTFLVRLKVTHFLPFLLCNLFLFGLTFVIPAENFLCRAFCVLCGAGYFLYTFYLRLKADSAYTKAFSPIFGVGVSVLGIYFLHYGTDKEWDTYYIFSLIGCLALQLISSYIRHYLYFLTVNKNSSGSLPVSEIFQSGLKLVLGYTLTGTLLLLLSVNTSWLETLLGFLKNIVFAVLRFLFSLLPNASIPEEALLEPQIDNSINNRGLPYPKGEPSLFWKILEKVAIAAALCIVLYGLFRFIRWLVRFLKRQFGITFQKKNLAVDEGYAPDIREYCGTEKSAVSKKKENFFGFLSPAERVRKLYKKKLLGASRQLAEGENARLGLFTARESEKKLGAEGMAAVYEKVRYSGEDASAEDVKRMKEACR